MIVLVLCFMGLGLASQDGFELQAENFVGYKMPYPATSFAMTKEYTLLAEQREMPYPTWMPESHNLFLCSNSDGNKEFVATADEPWVFVFTDGNVFYVLSAGYDAFTDIEHPVFTIQCYDPDTKVFAWEYSEELSGENGYLMVRDAVVLNETIFLIFENEIRAFDLHEHTLSRIYETQNALNNRILNRHACIYGNELIITNKSGEILAFDTKTHQTRSLATTITNINSGSDECIFSYYIYKDKLIYNLEPTYSMYTYDMQTGNVEFFISGRCGIACETPDGLYLEYADGGITKYFLNTDTMEETAVEGYDIDVINVWREILNQSDDTKASD